MEAASSSDSTNHEDVCKCVEVCLHTFLTLSLVCQLAIVTLCDRTVGQDVVWPSRELNPDSPVVHPVVSPPSILTPWSRVLLEKLIAAYLVK